MSDVPFVARPSHWRLALMLVGALAFVAAGLWMIGLFGDPPSPRRTWVGWIAAPLFGLFAIYGAVRLFDGSDQIVIDERGFTFRLWSDEHIPWSAVRAIDEVRIHKQIMFGIHLHDSSGHPPTRLVGKMAGLNRGLGFADLSLTVAGTDRKPDELRDALRQFAPRDLGDERR